jgi:hypothetical protein
MRTHEVCSAIVWDSDEHDEWHARQPATGGRRDADGVPARPDREDEDDARAAVDDDPNWLHLGDGRIIQGDAGFSVSSGWLELPHRYEAGDHITRHDPARVLAECEAKRRIVELAFSHAAKIDGEWGCCHSVQGIRGGLCDEQRPDDLALLRAARPALRRPPGLPARVEALETRKAAPASPAGEGGEAGAV